MKRLESLSQAEKDRMLWQNLEALLGFRWLHARPAALQAGTLQPKLLLRQPHILKTAAHPVAVMWRVVLDLRGSLDHHRLLFFFLDGLVLLALARLKHLMRCGLNLDGRPTIGHWNEVDLCPDGGLVGIMGAAWVSRRA